MQACFVQNFIDGPKMRFVDASALPSMGITDFEHVKVLDEYRIA
jgi:hypothetical protein